MLRSLRIGFATNSSSAHSVVLHSDPRFLGMLSGDTMSSCGQYGRDHFTFVDPDAKLAYLVWAHDRYNRMTFTAHQILSFAAQFPGGSGLTLDKIREQVSGFETEGVAGDVICPPGIDLALWFRFMMEAPVAIHGYDDNNGADFAHVTAQDPDSSEIGRMRWRQDGSALVGYNSETGLKFRWSADPYTKSTAPELVDMKITDYCAWGCKFCYQGSTTKGQHADWDVLKASVDAMAAAGVFEIAVGGGEPVEHPQFAELLTYAQSKDITLNFTTYGVDWATVDSPIVQAMKASYWSGGIGVSVHSLKDVDKVQTLSDKLSEANVYHAQVMAQTVIGATPAKATKAILERCIATDHPLLLLGYKTTGRGAGFAQRPVDAAAIIEILEAAKAAVSAPPKKDKWGGFENRRFTLSVDTAFVEAYGPELDAAGVPYVLRTSPEGKFSMYIDAVKNKAAPSSYCGDDLYVPWNPNTLVETFAQF